MTSDTNDPLLGDYLSEWLERRRNQLRPATVSTYRFPIEAYIKPRLGDVRVSELNRRMLEGLYEALVACGGRNGKPLAIATIQICHTVLRGALKDAQLDGLTETNPAAHARTPKRDPSAREIEDRTPVWTVDEVAYFLEQVEGHPWRALWHLAVSTGARRGELLGLRWKDVDLPAEKVAFRRSLTVVDGIARLLGTKTARSRVLTIGTSVVNALRRRRDEQQRHRQAAADDWCDQWGLVFTEPDGAYLGANRVTQTFRRLVESVGDLPVIHLHILRHTHASLLLEQGTPIKLISNRLGHSSYSMTMDTYAHLMPAMDQDAADRLDAVLREASQHDDKR